MIYKGIIVDSASNNAPDKTIRYPVCAGVHQDIIKIQRIDDITRTEYHGGYMKSHISMDVIVKNFQIGYSVAFCFGKHVDAVMVIIIRWVIPVLHVPNIIGVNLDVFGQRIDVAFTKDNAPIDAIDRIAIDLDVLCQAILRINIHESSSYLR